MTCPTIDRLIISQKKLRRGIFVNVDNFIGTLAKENENGLRKNGEWFKEIYTPESFLSRYVDLPREHKKID